MQGCLDENTLAQLVEGRLSEAERARVDLHLDACADCRKLFGAFARAAQPTGAADEIPPPATAFARGASVGRYVILSWVGGGGMGVVHAAYDPELDRKVALKLLRPPAPGTASRDEMRTRIQREAKAMARLSDPNVVAVHDVGTVGGEVFVAMEYVEGETVGTWLRQEKRSWRAILDVFLKAGHGLAAAHAAGVVHRDFKPDNVLLGIDGRVRVTDFGLAATMGTTDRTVAAPGEGDVAPIVDRLTRTGSLVGTPAYMAPEQIEGRPIDARTDLFSFCVALYEALYGERPFQGKDPEELRAAMARPRDPPRGGREPAGLRQAILRGLRYDPELRYGSMDALLRDLERAPRILRRRAAVLAIVLAVAGAGVLLWQSLAHEPSRICRGAIERLAGSWDVDRKAVVRAAFLAVSRPFAAEAWSKTEAVLDVYARDWAAMHTRACEATRVTGEQSEALLDLRMRCLEQRRQGLAALVVLFEHADAKIVARAPRAAHSLRALRDCADADALQAVVPLPSDPAIRARVEEVRGRLARVQAQRVAGRYRQGEKAAAAVVLAAKALDYPPVLAEALKLWGQLLSDAGAYDKSAQALREAIWAAEAGRDAKLAARAWAELAWTDSYRGKNDLALEHTTHASSVLRGAGGDPEIAGTIAHNKSGILLDLGRYDEALREVEVAVRQREIAFGPDHLQLGPSFNMMGVVLSLHGRPQEGLAHYLRALALQENALGKGHPLVGHTLFNTADAFAGVRRYADARAYAERSFRVLDQALGPEHPLIASALNVLGIVALGQGRYEEARRYAERAVAMGEKTRGKKSEMVARYYSTLGESREKLGRYAQARLAYQHSMDLHIAREGVQLSASIMMSYIARALLSAGAPAEAVPYLRRALRIQEAKGGGMYLAHTRFRLARALWRRPAERTAARALAQKALDFFSTAGPGFQSEAAEIRTWLARRQSR
jgi:tetratricopeptide (TPR) repeat protein